MDENVPIPLKVITKRKLVRAKKILENVSFNQGINPALLPKVLKLLEDVKDTKPKLFHGDNVYLGEKLAFAYKFASDITKAEYCLKTQAKFQPGCSDAYLNLGGFFSELEMWNKAITAYSEGLKINPQDEFIYFNLASLYRDREIREPALKALNNAILANPNRGINYKLKGDIHFDWGELEVAASYYEQAYELLIEPEWESIKLECLTNLAMIYRSIGDSRRALKTLEKAYVIYCKDVYTLNQLAILWAKEFNNWEKAKKFAEKALTVDFQNAKACLILSEYYQQTGDEFTAKRYAKIAALEEKKTISRRKRNWKMKKLKLI